MIPRLAGALLAVALASAAAGGAQPSSSRLVAVGDIHGDLAAFTTILKAAGLTAGNGQWSGGTATFVQTGDYLDRGEDVRRVMDLMRALEREAPRAGGRVRVLLGNHEVMNMLAEFRDVHPSVYATFADARSEQRRERAYVDHLRLAERRARALGRRPAVYDVADKAAWMKAHPPGFIEHAEAFARDGEYGRWLRDRDVAAVVHGTVLMHAGLDPATAPATIDALNRLVRDAIRRFDEARAHLVTREYVLPFFRLSEIIAAAQAEAEAINAGRASADAVHVERLNTILSIGRSPLLTANGPLWFRGFATWTDEEGQAAIAELLGRYDAQRFVTGHTVQGDGRIGSRFGHRLFLIDTGMLARVYRGRPSALEVSRDGIRAVYPDRRDLLVAAPQRPAPAR